MNWARCGVLYEINLITLAVKAVVRLIFLLLTDVCQQPLRIFLCVFAGIIWTTQSN